MGEKVRTNKTAWRFAHISLIVAVIFPSNHTHEELQKNWTTHENGSHLIVVFTLFSMLTYTQINGSSIPSTKGLFHQQKIANVWKKWLDQHPSPFHSAFIKHFCTDVEQLQEEMPLWECYLYVKTILSSAITMCFKISSLNYARFKLSPAPIWMHRAWTCTTWTHNLEFYK